jgi:hypothetical protein
MPLLRPASGPSITVPELPAITDEGKTPGLVIAVMRNEKLSGLDPLVGEWAG